MTSSGGGPRRAPRTVVVLAPRDPARLARVVADLTEGADGADADDEVVVLDQRSVADLHDRMRRLPRVDEVVDARVRNEALQWRRWVDLFLHLRPGGRWVALRPADAGDGGFAERVTGLVADPTGHRRRLQEPAKAVEEVTVEAHRVVITKRGEHLLKVRDREVEEVLAERAPDLRVTELAQVAGGRIELDGRVTSHGFLADEMAAPIDYPPLHLRRYEGRLELLEGAVLKHGTTLLPDSYRWHLQGNPINLRLMDVSEHWARTRQPEPVKAHLDGSYYYFDYKNPGHYGHLMTEALARLWGWDAAKAADPDLRLLCRRSPREIRTGRPRADHVLLRAYGIAADDVVWVDRAVSADRVVGLTPMWHNKAPYSAHPGIREVWRRLREGLPTAEAPDLAKIFVTRRKGHRYCHDTAAVEALFAEHGYTVVEPGTMTIPQQAVLFGRARVVAGFGGTGMFNLAWADRLEAVVVLNQTAYDARNELLLAAVLGAEAHFFWGAPDLAHPPDGWSYDAFQSPWSFDVDAQRVELSAVLRRLG